MSTAPRRSVQDLVNLIVCGHAVSNVHDGVKHLDEHTQLGGVPAVGPVGFLSLFEWYAVSPPKPRDPVTGGG